MRFVDLIDKKAHGDSLTTEEIQQMVTGFVSGEIPDYQMSSMMMAILQRGMTSKETADLTMSMMHSGDVVDLSDLPGIKLDKHSTGGVGDTTTLIVAPLVAACGGTVAKMSGACVIWNCVSFCQNNFLSVRRCFWKQSGRCRKKKSYQELCVRIWKRSCYGQV